MLKTDKIIIVEGRYDKIKLSSIIDAVIIETEGFGIFKDKHKQKMLRRLSETKQIVILTDSDSAGFVIRNFISGFIPKDRIINAYIPDVYGKEKRKPLASKEGKLGVEGISPRVLRDALEKAGVLCETEEKKHDPITKQDLYSDGLSGGHESSKKRAMLLKYLDLPSNMTVNAMLDIMNVFMSYDDYKTALSRCTKEDNNEIILQNRARI